jgi:hypothetical protein
MNNIIEIRDTINPGIILNSIFAIIIKGSVISFTHDNKVNNLTGKNKAIIPKNIFKLQIKFIYLICDSNSSRLISKSKLLSSFR